MRETQSGGVKDILTTQAYGVKVSGSQRCLVSNNVIFNDPLLIGNSTALINTVGVYLANYAGERSNYCLVTGNNIHHLGRGVAEKIDGVGTEPEARHNVICGNQIANSFSKNIDLAHNRSIYSEWDAENARITWGQGRSDAGGDGGDVNPLFYMQGGTITQVPEVRFYTNVEYPGKNFFRDSVKSALSDSTNFDQFKTKLTALLTEDYS